MPKTATKEQWRTLRRYALAGDMDTARHLLKTMVQESPEDEEAQAELKRLENGEPLLITESPKTRRNRLGEEAQQELSVAVSQYGSKELACKPTEELKVLKNNLRRQLALLKEAKIYAPRGTGAYKRRLDAELARRQKKHSRTNLRLVLCLLGALALLSGVTFALYSRARNAVSRLDEACQNEDWIRVQVLLKNADTGINRLMNSETEGVVNQVKAWQIITIRRSTELTKQLDIYRRRRMISSLSLEERAAFLREIRSLPEHFSQELQKQWDELCRPEKEALDNQRAAIIAELREPIPRLELTGEPKKDQSYLIKARDQLQAVVKKFNDAKDTFNLDPLLITVTQNRLDQVKIYLSDVEMLLRAQSLLKNSLTYTHHLQALSGLTPKLYAPAITAAELCRSFPGYDEICSEMRYRIYEMPKNLPQEITAAITDKAPSFSPKHPATREQVDCMQDIFTSRTLRKKIYDICNHVTGERYYVDQPPSVKDNKAVFTISELDEHYKTGHSNRVECDAKAVWFVELDATPLLRAADFSRDQFFLATNLPDALGRITGIHQPNCPALAKAYVYHTLLSVIEQDPNAKDSFGLRYSKTLAQDIRDFHKLCDEIKLRLTVGCWMSRSPEHATAETLFARWFQEHADRDYCAEMSKTFSDINRKRLRYIGYVDEDKQPCFKSEPMPDKRLWYFSAGKLTSSFADQPLASPSPYSPVFSE